MTITFPEYGDFVEEMFGYRPYKWQEEMSERLFAGAPPSRVDVEAGMGKSSVVEAWVWAFAKQRSEILAGTRERSARTAPMRLHFVVDRRVIVDEVHDRAEKIQALLSHAVSGTPLGVVASALTDRRPHSSEPDGGEQPFDVVKLRGGMPDPAEHTRLPHVPTVITSTVDLFGSRLLFRGYGVSWRARAIDAALTGCDTLIVVDEAHLSAQLVKTLQVLNKPYPLRGLDQDDAGPLRRNVMTMSATDVVPGGSVLAMDRSAEEAAGGAALKNRLAARDAVTVEVRDAVGGSAVPGALADEAIKLSPRGPEDGRTVCVFVNTPKQAAETETALRKSLSKADPTGSWRVVTLHGRMDGASRALGVRRLRGAMTRSKDRQFAPHFVIATQVLEVGADLDFDDVVTLGCSLDAFIQRAGRCNRLGLRPGGRVVVIPEEKPSGLYESTAGPTVRILRSSGDMGRARAAYRDEAEKHYETVEHDPIRRHTDPRVLDRVVFDDLLVTAPQEWEAPVAAWIRDEIKRSSVDVVRRDFAGLPPDLWAKYVESTPVMPWEGTPLPVYEASGPIYEAAARTSFAQDGSGMDEIVALVIRNGKVRTVLASEANAGEKDDSPAIVRPGDVVIVQDQDPCPDVMACDPAYLDGGSLHPGRLVLIPECMSFSAAVGMEKGAPAGSAEANALADCLAEELPPEHEPERVDDLAAVAVVSRNRLVSRICEALRGQSDERHHISVINYEGAPACAVITVRPKRSVGAILTQRTSLKDHNAAVGRRAREWAREIGLPDSDVRTVGAAGDSHDNGKAAPWFQRLLYYPDDPSGDLVAKSLGRTFNSRWDRMRFSQEASARSGVPDGFRHEAQSVAINDRLGAVDPLVRHLVGSHHGYGRGLIPAIRAGDSLDRERTSFGGVEIEGVPLQDPRRSEWAAWATQFRMLNDQVGPYRLAFLEAVLRLSDWECSREDVAAETQPGEEDEVGT